MAIEANVQDNSNPGIARLFTGLLDMEVVAINPTNAQKKELGVNLKPDALETEYMNENDLRIDFWLVGQHYERVNDKLETVTIRSKHNVWLKNELVDKLFINENGAFSKNQEKLTGHVRHPYSGEIDLLLFLQAWADPKKGSSCSLDSIHQMVKSGKVKELTDLLNGIRNNRVKVLLGVKTNDKGSFQVVYPKKIERSWTRSYAFLHESLSENRAYLRGVDYGPINLDYYNERDFMLQEWNPAITAPSNTEGVQSATSHTQLIQGAVTAANQISKAPDLPKMATSTVTSTIWNGIKEGEDDLPF